MIARRTRVRHLCLAAAFATLLAGRAAVVLADVGDPFDDALFGRRMRIAFSGFSGPTPLTNFPALVVLNTGISNFSYGHFLANGADLRFTDSSGRELAFEIESWNPTGNSFVWVKVPMLRSRGEYIDAYWQNSNASPPSYTTNGTAWESGFVGVWHMGGTNATDSTARRNNGTAGGGGVSTVAGLAGAALAFSGSSYVDINYVANDVLANGMALELSAWVKTTDPDGSSGTGHSVISAARYAATSAGRQRKVTLAIGPSPTPGNGEPCVIDGLSTVEADSSVSVADGSWHHLVYVRDGTGTDTSRLYIDGVERAVHTANFSLATNDLWSLGQSILTGVRGRYFLGTMDEVRVSSVVRSPAWVKACADTMRTSAGFATYGSVEKQPSVRAVSPRDGAVVGSTAPNVEIEFSRAVQGVDQTDLVLDGPAAAGATVGPPSDLGANVWRFPLEGLVDGALRLSLAPDAGDIQDLGGLDLSNLVWNYLIDTTRPVVTSWTPAAGSAIRTPLLDIGIGFSELVKSVDATDLALSGEPAVTASVGTPAYSNGVWHFPVSGLLQGALTASLAQAPGSIEDMAGNTLSNVVCGYLIDFLPTVTAKSPLPNSFVSSNMTVDVTFSEPVQDVDMTDLVPSGSAATNARVVSATSAGGSTWRFEIRGLATGLLNLTLAGHTGDIRDFTGNDIPAVTWRYWADLVPPGTNWFSQVDAGLTPLHDGCLAWGDYDADGDLDLLLSGTGNGDTTVVHRNQGLGVFTNAQAGLPHLHDSMAAWGDYDRDGDLDLVLSGVDAGLGGHTFLYRNDTGRFTLLPTGLPSRALNGSWSWGDFDNNGDLDLWFLGDWYSWSGVCVNGGGSFSSRALGISWGYWDGNAEWGDYDNDGYLDIVLMGYSQRDDTPVSCVRPNNGGTSLGEPVSLASVAHGKVTWGDYNADGYLDILLTGNTKKKEASPLGLAKVYRNNRDGTFTEVDTSLVAIFDGDAAWGDFDNDGDMDIAMVGNNGTNLVGSVYRNDREVFFPVAELPGLQDASLAWGDYDNDGRLDLVLMGEDESAARMTLLFHNNSPTSNSCPEQPSGLSVHAIATDAVRFTWQPAADAQTPGAGLTYNLRVGTRSGAGDAVPPMSLTNGRRLLPGRGNANHRLYQTVKGLRTGTNYYWSVQAIDNGMAGGAWAEEQVFRMPFTITSVAGAHGRVSPLGSIWVTEGGSTNFVATADRHYHIATLLTNGYPDTMACERTAYTAYWHNVVANGTVAVSFAENLATNRTPEWWLAQYGWSNDFDAAALADRDEDGMAAWAERVAGTDPTDARSCLAISAFSNVPPLRVYFHSATGRVYRLQYRQDIATGNWHALPGQTNAVGTGGRSWLDDTNPAGPRCYRIGVDLP